MDIRVCAVQFCNVVELWQRIKGFASSSLWNVPSAAPTPTKRSPGVSRYTTMKNRRNTTARLELKKFCPHCNKHVVHKEIK